MGEGHRHMPLRVPWLGTIHKNSLFGHCQPAKKSTNNYKKNSNRTVHPPSPSPPRPCGSIDPSTVPTTQVITSPHHQTVITGWQFSEQVDNFFPSILEENWKLDKILFYDVLAEIFSFPNIYWSRGFWKVPRTLSRSEKINALGNFFFTMGSLIA